MDDEKNCFKHGAEVISYVHHCNIGDYVEVFVNNNNYLDARIYSPTRMGHFDCWAIEQTARDEVNAQHDDYRNALGAETPVETGAECSSRQVSEVNSEDTTGNGQTTELVGYRGDVLSVRSPQHRIVIVAHSPVKQNVETTVGQQLHDEVYKALDYLCPKDADQCTVSENGKPKVYNIEVVDVEDQILVRRPLGISIRNSSYKKDEKLRVLMIRTAAGVLWHESIDQKNCYLTTHGIPPGFVNKITLCNVGNFVGVNLQGPYIDVKIHFPTKAGNFDCPAILEATDKEVLAGLLPEYKDALDDQDVSTDVFCLKDCTPVCFDADEYPQELNVTATATAPLGK